MGPTDEKTAVPTTPPTSQVAISAEYARETSIELPHIVYIGPTSMNAAPQTQV